MAFTVAVAGKGGVGKTTFCALLIRWLIDKKKTPVLAVDADPNSNLSEALGVNLEGGDISDIIAQTKELGGIPPSMSQDEFISYRLDDCLTESDYFDLIAMGKPDGPGCYCFPNNVLKKHLTKLMDKYKVVVMDNEAGLEHISRGTTMDYVDALFILSDISQRAVRSAGRVYDLTKELKVPVKSIFLVITRGKEEEIGPLGGEIAKIGIPSSGCVPPDPTITEYELAGRPLYELPGDAPSVASLERILNETLGGLL